MATITFEEITDSGSVDISGCSDNGTDTTIIDPRLFTFTDSPGGWGGGPDLWQWVYVKMNNCLGETREIRVPRAGKYPSGQLQVWVYSEDNGTTWTAFPTAQVDPGDSDWFEYAKGSAWASASVLVASAVPYPYATTQARVAAWKSDAKVFPTASGDADLIVGQTGGGYTDNQGRAVPDLPLYGFRIGLSSVPKTSAIVLTGGTHPGESHGRLTLEELVDWLLSSDTDAVALRRKCDVYVYPCICADGVRMGYFRTSPRNEAVNTNRLWDTASDGLNPVLDIWKSIFSTDLNGVDVVGWWDTHFKHQTESGGYYNNTATIRQGLARLWTADTVSAHSPSSVFVGEQGLVGYESWLVSAAQERWGAKVGIVIEQDESKLPAAVATWAEDCRPGIVRLLDTWLPSARTAYARSIDALAPTWHFRFAAEDQYPIRGPRVGSFVGTVLYGASLTNADAATDGCLLCDGTFYLGITPTYFPAYSAANGCTFVWLMRMDPVADNLGRYIFGHSSGGGFNVASSLNFGITGTSAAAYPGLFVAIKDSDNNGYTLNGATGIISDYDDGVVHVAAFGWGLVGGVLTVRLWWDGVLVDEETPTFDPAKFAPSGNFIIGTRSDADATRRYKGELDEHLRFDRLLTTAEVLQITRLQSADSLGSLSVSGAGQLGFYYRI